MNPLRQTAESVEIPIRETGDVAIAVSQAQHFARACGADAWLCAKIATACSELASNIVKYANHGKIVFCQEFDQGRNAVVIWAYDRGPGIKDPEQAMQESFSSGGTLGLGLSSVCRIMDSFSILTSGPTGCCIVARKYIPCPV